MKKIYLFVVFAAFSYLFTACKTETAAESKRTADDIFKIAAYQYDILYDSVKPRLIDGDKKIFPRTVKNETLIRVSAYDWTSGFFPGSLWYLYELTKDEKYKTRAVEFTEALDTIQYWSGNHDVGFMMECSYGNGLKYNDSKAYEEVIVQTARSLSKRFHPKAGILQSWDSGEKWGCPVIVDNMMNLELLFHATQISGDSTFYNIAISHADKTMQNHFRDDYSSYHVLNYDTETGEVLNKNTHQGYADESAWARGQAWGLYGFVMCYRETKQAKYLEQAQHIADFIMNNPNLPDDKVPYWDYNVPKTETTPRDASAAAITASALIELSEYAQKDKYLHWADLILESLSTPDYLAAEGSNKGFILKHSVGSLPHNSEIDVPLNYADYYFLEALSRRKQIK